MDQQKACILCVEDNADSREMLRIALDAYEIVTAGSVGEGLSLAKTGGFHLYLLDSRFPDGSGVELCRQIRAFDNKTPVLFQSADSGESYINAAIEAGAQEYLAKPFGIDELEQSIERLLKQAQQAVDPKGP